MNDSADLHLGVAGHLLVDAVDPQPVPEQRPGTLEHGTADLGVAAIGAQVLQLAGGVADHQEAAGAGVLDAYGEQGGRELLRRV
ncbi:hypothetical protein [Streptomyces sp. TP-A0356]|uniref:hypothetical protein n=1 Tax=Streptomyces sp. TP-A0356 TaxID=1359208 RepID=UPI00131D65F4|nr:hypothetical protein [Streptomyces sp. TP-A0356]